MDLWELLKVMARRWYVVVPVLIVTAIVAITLPPTIDPEYRASGTMILVGPAGTAAELNPFLTAGLGTNAEASAIVVQSPNSKAVVAEQGLSTDYEVQADGPVLVITASAESPSQAVDTVTFVEELLNAQLVDLQTQAAVPAEAQLSVVPLIPEVVATPVYQSRLRVTILTVVIGVLTAVLVAMAVEGLSRHRSGARRPRRESRRSRESRRPPAAESAQPARATPAPEADNVTTSAPDERELSRPAAS